MPFKVGMFYTREYIHQILGGSTIAFLPMVDGMVVAGCFRRDWNFRAPEIIFIGIGPIRESSAEQFVNQGNFVPVFIKRDVNEWEYIGKYKAVNINNDPTEIRKVTGRIEGIGGLLYLEKEK